MEPVEQSTKPQPEMPELPRRRRLWWLLVPFFILSALVVLGVLALGKPPIHQYDFMAKARLVSSDELLLTDSLGRVTYHGEFCYEVDHPRKDFASHASDELFFLGWSTVSVIDTQRQMEYPSDGANISLSATGTTGEVTLNVTRVATVMDRIRVWLKDHLSSNSKKSASKPTLVER